MMRLYISAVGVNMLLGPDDDDDDDFDAVVVVVVVLAIASIHSRMACGDVKKRAG